MYPSKVDGHDPIHPDDHGPPVHEDVDFPNEDVDDSGEQDDDDGMNDPPADPPSGGQTANVSSVSSSVVSSSL